MTGFVEVTDEWELKDGGERWVRTIDKTCWISVLHRMTGFGYMEWETAICLRPEFITVGNERQTLIIAGDQREELSEMPKEELLKWYADNIEGNQNSFDSLILDMKSRLKEGEW